MLINAINTFIIIITSSYNVTNKLIFKLSMPHYRAPETINQEEGKEPQTFDGMRLLARLIARRILSKRAIKNNNETDPVIANNERENLS